MTFFANFKLFPPEIRAKLYHLVSADQDIGKKKDKKVI